MTDKPAGSNLPPRIDLATVVYEPEVMMLKLQARSIRLFFRPRDIGSIFIIVNEMAPESTYSAIKLHVLEEYGDLLKHVQIIPASHLMRPHVSVGGWRTQQSLKLLISSYVETPNYLLLDAKNHFVRPVSMRTFFDGKTGKMRTFKVANHDALQNYLTNSLEYFGVEPRGSYLPATTPFTMSTIAVRALVQNVIERERSSFDEFMHRSGRDVTEFFLYYAFIEKHFGGVDQLYRYGGRNTVTFFTRYPKTPEQIESLIQLLYEDKTLVFGLHKNRVQNLDDEFVKKIKDFWLSRGLFGDDAELEAFYSALICNVSHRSITS